jgi:hypothetical protein
MRQPGRQNLDASRHELQKQRQESMYQCDFFIKRNIFTLMTKKRTACQRRLVRIMRVNPVGMGG